MNTPQEKLYNAWQYPKYFSRCRAYRPLALSQNSRSQLTEQHRALCRIWQVWGLNLKQAGKQPTFQGLPQAAVDFPALSLDLSSPSGPSLFSSGFCSKGMSWAIPLNTLLTLLGSLLSSTPLQRLQLSLIPGLFCIVSCFPVFFLFQVLFASQIFSWVISHFFIAFWP